jgi:hypothetical protein
MPEPAKPDTRRVTPWGLLLAALTLVMWVRFLVFPSLVAGDGLDPSWMQALGHFYRTGAQAGTEYVFTYGPLGYFATWVHDGDLYWQRYLWELVVKLAAAVVVVTMLARLPGRGLTLLGAALVIVFVPYHFDTIYQVTLLAAGALLVEGACRSWPRAALVVPLLSVLALTKFTYFVVALWAAAVAEGAARLRGYRGWLSPAPVTLLGILAVWLVCRQNPLHLWAYCRYSWEVSTGYAEAMIAPGLTPEVALAAAAMGLAVFLLLLAAWRQRRSVFHVSTVLFLGPALFLGWKHGLTRAADDHPVIFFGVAMFVGLLVARLLMPTTTPFPWVVLGGLLACCVGGTLLISGRLKDEDDGEYFGWSVKQTRTNLAAALSPVATKATLDAKRDEQAERWRLDRVREVGDAPLDQLSCEQGVVLLNGLNWHPRPVFQSYSAYTPALLRANADFFRSDAAPDYVLCNLKPVDGRLGGMEDGPALLEILRRYAPVATERQFVLFERVPAKKQTPEPERTVVCRRMVRFDEEVSLEDVPGEYQLMSLNVTPSLRGRLWGVGFRREALYLELHTASGATLRGRLVPDLARDGFLINPLLNTTADLVRLYGTSCGDRVASFRITPTNTDFKDEIEMTVWTVPRLPCRKLGRSAVDALVPE